jgi:hypothetical protein
MSTKAVSEWDGLAPEGCDHHCSVDQEYLSSPVSTATKKTCDDEQFCTVRASCLAQIIPSTREVVMHSKDRLANALREAGLPLMAKMAAAGVYSNGLSLHAMPEMVLRRDLEDAHSTLASALLWRVDKGEFEATDEELDAGDKQMVRVE